MVLGLASTVVTCVACPMTFSLSGQHSSLPCPGCFSDSTVPFRLLLPTPLSKNGSWRLLSMPKCATFGSEFVPHRHFFPSSLQSCSSYVFFFFFRGIVTRDTLWDKLVLKQIQDRMGGRLRLFACGSAPISEEVYSFCRAALGVHVSFPLLL